MRDHVARTGAVPRKTIVGAARWALIVHLALAASIAAAQAPSDVRDSAAPFRIFFDWGKTSVSQDGAATLDKVAAILLQPGAGTARIEGHSDRSGSFAANRRSALQRAAAARDYLVRRGVAPARIAIATMGEQAPFIATADGVREPQNRRVDVMIAGVAAR